VIVQHLAVRPGNGAGGAPDAMGAHRGSSGAVHDVLFEHCSATWAVDENLSVSGPADVGGEAEATAHHVTLRSCLIAEGLSHAGHPKGEHSKGTLIHDGVRGIEIVGCLFAHNVERNPRLKGGTTALVHDNVMYDWAAACVGVGARGNKKMLAPAEVILTGNIAIPGPATRTRLFVKSVDPGARVSLGDNITTDLRVVDDGVVVLPPPPHTAHPSLEQILRTAGSRPAHRDPVDARIVQSVIDRTGGIIDSQEQVGGYPVRPATKRAIIVPDGSAARRAWLEKLSEEVTAPSPSR
jgi:hypothetical protein